MKNKKILIVLTIFDKAEEVRNDNSISLSHNYLQT